MIKAEALFKRHLKEFPKLFNLEYLELTNPDHRNIATTLYAACIIAEAIRNEQDDGEFKEPKD